MGKSLNNKTGTIRKRILTLIFIVYTVFAVNGQTSGFMISEDSTRDSILAARLYEQAKNSFELDSFNLALNLAAESLHSAMRSNQEDTEIASLLLIAEVYGRMESPGDAVPYYLRIANTLEARHDTLALRNIYARIAESYHLEKVYDKEGQYYLNSLNLVHEKEAEERAQLTEKIGVALLQEYLIDSSVCYLQIAQSLYGEMGMDNTHVLNYLVRAYNQSGQFAEAIKLNEILFERYRQKEDIRQMSTLKNNIGYNLTLMGDYSNAALSFREAIDFGQKAGIPEQELAHLMSNAGICYQNMTDSKQARQFFQQALEAFTESGLTGEKSRQENIIALIYYHEEDLYNAGIFSRESIISAREANDPRLLSAAYLTYSRILREGNDPIQALEYYEEYLSIRDSLQLENKLKEQEIARKRLQLEKTEKDLKIKLKEERVKELAIQQLTLKLEKEEQEKELMRKEKDMQLLEQERLRQSLVITRQQHAVEKQRRENQLLEQEKSISDLRLEKEMRVKKEQEQEIILLEKQKQLDQFELTRQKNAKKVLIVFIVLGILFTLLIISNLISSRKKRIRLGHQKKEIEQKNVDLENKNEEISAQRDEIETQRDQVFKQKNEIEQYNLEVMKSIEYAKKIQSSTLPDLTSLNTSISDFFVFFKPRDIVSGDFYWTAKVENTTVLTVSDCTGHGVPGAFMSMLGMSLLNEIVQKEYITMPGVILRRLRKGIINTLGQKGISGEQRDGMDMALVAIDHKSRIIQYSGAYNPLYLVRRKGRPEPGIKDLAVFEETFDNDYVLYEIRADKMPIAHYIHMGKFATHKIEILDGDIIYFFTDGYADQFGGPKGKKFKYKPFKRLLLQHAHLPMNEQERILNDTLEKWMKNIEQVDDICVMGLKMDTVRKIDNFMKNKAGNK